jgi:hypothetical protein
MGDDSSASFNLFQEIRYEIRKPILTNNNAGGDLP